MAKTRRRKGRARPQITAWSASRVFTHQNCPAKIGFDLAGYKEPKGPALVRGQDIHAQGERYLKTPRSQLPAAYSYFADEMKALRKAKAIAEESWAFLADWSLCDWLDPMVRCRMKIDAHLVQGRGKLLRVVDFKTGKVANAKDEQLDLYAVGGFHRYPKVEVVEAEFWFLDTGDVTEITYERDVDLARCQSEWEARGLTLIEDTKLEATPNPLCGWCGFSKKKGGPCAH